MTTVTLTYDNEDPEDDNFGEEIQYTVEIPWSRIGDVINTMDEVAGEDEGDEGD